MLRSPGRRTTRSGRSRPVVAGRLLVEVAVRRHAGQLDDAPELHLAPAPAHAGALERQGQRRRLLAQAPLRLVQAGDALGQRAVAGLHPPQPGVHAVERLAHGTQQLVDRRLPRLEVAPRALLELAELRARQIEERPVVRVERLARQRIERLAQPRLGGLVDRLPLGGQPSLAVELGVEPHQRLARLPESRPGPETHDQPGREDAHHHADPSPDPERHPVDTG